MMKKLRLTLAVIRRRWFVISLTAIVGLLAVSVLLVKLPKTYEAASHVLIVNDTAGRDPSVSSIDLPIVASSTVVLDRVIDRLHLTIPLAKLKSSVKIKVGSRSSIMEIRYRDGVAERAVAVPNSVADELALYYEQISTARANVTVRKLDVAIAAVEQRLLHINGELAGQSADAPFLDSDKALDGLTTRLDDLELQRQMAGAALVSDSAEASATSGNRRGLTALSRHEMLQNDPVYTDIVAQLARDQAELTADAAVHTRQHPQNQYLALKVAGELSSLRAESSRFLQSADAFSPALEQNAEQSRKAQATLAGDRARIASLDRVIATERSRLSALPRASVTTAWLRLQRDSAQADYLTLTSHRNAAVASRAEALSLGSVVVVDRAVRADTATVGMGRMQLGLLSVVFVLGLALGSGFLVEMFDPRLRREDQIENLYGVPLLTTLSGNKS